jgi:hypothetical protein
MWHTLKKTPKQFKKYQFQFLIRDAISRLDMKFKILLLLSVIPLFEEYLTEFQSEHLLIQLLHTRMSQLVITVMRRFLTPDVVKLTTESNLTSTDFGINSQLKDDEIEIGEAKQEKT